MDTQSRQGSDLVLLKQRILLCGGPDMCGKTNILKAVQERTGIPYFKATDEHVNFLHGQDRFLAKLRHADTRTVDFLTQTGYDILIDRSYPCEWVYSRFFKRETDHDVMKDVDESFARIGAKVLVCTRKSFSGIVDDLDSRLDQGALVQISSLYEEFLSWTKCESYKLYVDDENLEREINEVLRFLNG